jgi:hypothetical protein
MSLRGGRRWLRRDIMGWFRKYRKGHGMKVSNCSPTPCSIQLPIRRLGRNGEHPTASPRVVAHRDATPKQATGMNVLTMPSGRSGRQDPGAPCWSSRISTWRCRRSAATPFPGVSSNGTHLISCISRHLVIGLSPVTTPGDREGVVPEHTVRVTRAQSLEALADAVRDSLNEVSGGDRELLELCCCLRFQRASRAQSERREPQSTFVGRNQVSEGTNLHRCQYAARVQRRCGSARRPQPHWR